MPDLNLSRVLLAGLMLAGVSPVALAASVAPVDHGAIITPDHGAPVRILSYGDRQFRVSVAQDGAFADLPQSLMVNVPANGTPIITKDAKTVKLTLPGLVAHVALANGQVSFTDAAGKPLLAETARSVFTPTKADGQPYVTVSQRFNPGTDEGFYGLGQHQNRQMDYNGQDVELAQHNMDIAVPFVVSTKGYGLLWDNNGITRFGNPHAYELAGQDGLKVTSGGKPGWHADYYLGGKLAVSRQESAINYQYIRDQQKWPEAAKARTVASADSGQNTAGVAIDKQSVIWTGSISSAKAGEHTFRLYSSSYVKVFADGKPVLERWRQNWNPWYHNFSLPMAAHKPIKIRIEWEPNAGYIALLHNDPLPAPERHALTMTSDVAKGLDYYVVGGGSADGVISAYRAITGKASMMPQWAFGFWQSRQRYETQEQLLGVLREYRKRHIPLDTIVEDWFYWPENQWGSHDFDTKRFPDAKGMVDEVHALGARVMISVWPKFYPGTDNAKALADKGWLYQGNLKAGNKDWVGPGYLNTDYDPYAKGARDLFFAQMKPKLVDKGFDAWWLDASEPDIHSNLSIEERIDTMGPTAHGPAASVFNSFPLMHAEGIAEHMREARPDVRPFILTRSGFAGLQRASSAVWSGDLAARWDDLRDQISAGVNISLSGLPYWTHDIGGFAVEDRYTKQEPSAQAEWKELNLRWFQFGAFSPLFRSHGEFPRREIYELGASDPALYDALIKWTRLRYRLMPYIYTLGADAAQKDGSIMRGLVMDFPSDTKARKLDDQYLFGPSILVAPVTSFGARSRSVYLPQGADWYDLNSGAFYKGGQTIAAKAELDQMPLFARAGSIIPTGPQVEHTGEQPDGPLVIQVYTGANGHFELYEDDGTSQAYAKGQSARVALDWDDKAHTLTLGARVGSFPGMAAQRAVSVRCYGPYAKPLDFAENGATQATYTGEKLVIACKP
jgi:alpha-D-xyloside xylohydrolase